jgi:hypothetical protein
MSNVLFINGFILLIVWAVGYFGFQIDGFIHVLLIVAILTIVIKIFYIIAFYKNHNPKININGNH